MVIFVLLDFIDNELSASLGGKRPFSNCLAVNVTNLVICPIACLSYLFWRILFNFILAQSVINLRFQGAAIVDQPVCIIRWGEYTDEPNPWISSWGFDENSGSTVCFKILQYAVD